MAGLNASPSLSTFAPEHLDIGGALVYTFRVLQSQRDWRIGSLQGHKDTGAGISGFPVPCVLWRYGRGQRPRRNPWPLPVAEFEVTPAMPIYEYECKACGVRFERKQKWHEDPVKECPECQAEVRKVLHPAGIVFKGSGFYKTDYSSSGSRQEHSEKKDETKSTPPSESKAADKAESKPESKAETKSDKKD